MMNPVPEAAFFAVVSKSGNTPEIKVLVPLIKQFGNKLIAIVGNRASFLASEADIVLDATVSHEACPNNLAPTSSTTAQLVMGDALAVALIECRNFTASDFARFHPGGALGKQLLLRIFLEMNLIQIIKTIMLFLHLLCTFLFLG